MQVLLATPHDIPAWYALSAEYDRYVRPLTENFALWYEGDAVSIAFSEYTKTKIAQKEAIMATHDDGSCLGFAAFSKKHNRITFFAVTHSADPHIVGEALLSAALAHLNRAIPLSIRLIASPAPWIAHHKSLLIRAGFQPAGDTLENGVPVHIFATSPD